MYKATNNNNRNIGSWKVTFGKYKGSTYQQLLDRDPDYAKWFSGVTYSDSVKEWLQQRLVECPTTQVTDVSP